MLNNNVTITVHKISLLGSEGRTQTLIREANISQVLMFAVKLNSR